MARGIIRMNDNHPTRALRNRLLARMKINMPSLIKAQRIARKLHVLNVGEEAKEPITGLGDQDLITGVAERAENERVCLARTGGDNYVLDGNLVSASGVVCGNRSAS